MSKQYVVFVDDQLLNVNEEAAYVLSLGTALMEKYYPEMIMSGSLCHVASSARYNALEARQRWQEQGKMDFGIEMALNAEAVAVGNLFGACKGKKANGLPIPCSWFEEHRGEAHVLGSNEDYLSCIFEMLDE